jgi:hypothetical protein
MNLFEVTQELVNRLARIFLRDDHGRHPVYGGAAKFQTDPIGRDHLLLYEYFHGDNGAGLGASHQTIWTGFIAKQIQFFGLLKARTFLERGRSTGIFYLEASYGELIGVRPFRFVSCAFNATCSNYPRQDDQRRLR